MRTLSRIKLARYQEVKERFALGPNVIAGKLKVYEALPEALGTLTPVGSHV